MGYEVPTLPALIARAQSDLAGTEGLRHSDAQVLSRVMAGGNFGLYGYMQWVAAQILPDTCDEEMLLRLAKLRPIRDRLPATAATGSAAGAGTPGAVLDAGVLFQRDDGVLLRVAVGVTLTAGTVNVQLEAVEAGVMGNTPAGAALRLVSPVRGIVDGFTVTGNGIAGGVEQESIEALRVRVIRSHRELPHGGNGNDYETWALEVPGVTRAWVRRNWLGPGTVAVFIMRDGDPNPIPTEEACAQVLAYITEPGRAPVTAEVYVLAPAAKVVQYASSVTPDTSAVRAAVEASLRELHFREAEPGATLLRTHIAEAISTSAGERDHALALPAADVTAAPNEILMFGGIEWR